MVMIEMMLMTTDDDYGHDDKVITIIMYDHNDV